MNTLIAILIFIFGSIIGSFLNVLILRYNTGFGVSGRSKCFSCSKELKWFELIPIFSFVFLRGKCFKCKSKISWQYPIVEFTTGLIFVLIFFFGRGLWPDVSIPILIIDWVIASLMIVMAVYDLKHKIIPNAPVYIFIVLSLVLMIINHSFGTFDILAGPILALPFALIWLVSKGTWIGFGDIKLMLGIGWYLGLNYGLSAVILAFWTGTAVGISSLFLSKNKLTIKSEIPLAPFLILGLYIVFFLGTDFFHINDFLFN